MKLSVSKGVVYKWRMAILVNYWPHNHILSRFLGILKVLRTVITKSVSTCLMSISSGSLEQFVTVTVIINKKICTLFTFINLIVKYNNYKMKKVLIKGNQWVDWGCALIKYLIIIPWFDIDFLFWIWSCMTKRKLYSRAVFFNLFQFAAPYMTKKLATSLTT